MALQKTITFPSGLSGNYIKLTAYSWDAINREASAHFSLYKTAQKAEDIPDQPLVLVAVLRLEGAKFDQYLSTDALDALKNPGPDPVRDQLYAAVQVEPLSPGGGLTRDQLTLKDATDV